MNKTASVAQSTLNTLEKINMLHYAGNILTELSRP